MRSDESSKKNTYNKKSERNEKEKRKKGERGERGERGETAKNDRREELVIGRNAVREALKSSRPADCLYIAKGDRSSSVSVILAMCAEKRIPVKEADSRKLDFMCGGANHQGVILSAAAKEYSSVDDIFDLAAQRGEDPFIVICDGLEDPHNLGAVIRSAEAAGVHGVIIPERRSVGLTFTVSKSSAGALEYMPVARVANITSAIEQLKKRGVWIYAADMDGAPYCDTDMSGASAIVIGSEGRGVSRLVKENADFVVSVPMKGKINSLNASVAAGILIFRASECRSKKK